MLKYTSAAIHKIINDLILLAHVSTIVMQVFMILYLTVAIIIGSGSLPINLALVTVNAVGLTVYLITYGKKDKKSKASKDITERVCTWAKIILNAISLASVIYTIYATSEEVTRLTLVLTPLMIIMWVLQVSIELVKQFVTRRARLFLDGIRMDFEFIAKPIIHTKNFINDMMGEEKESTDIVSVENRRILTEQAERDKKERASRESIFSKTRRFFGGLVMRVWRRLFPKKKKPTVDAGSCEELPPPKSEVK